MTNASVQLKRFGSADALQSQVASDIAALLAGAIAARGQAGLLVSGGHSPAGLFRGRRRIWAPQLPGVPRTRISLNLRALLDSRRILIFLLGEAKLRTYTDACGPGSVEEMPVRAVLRQERVPVEAAWAP